VLLLLQDFRVGIGAAGKAVRYIDGDQFAYRPRRLAVFRHTPEVGTNVRSVPDKSIRQSLWHARDTALEGFENGVTF
jgi:hypothetical protein